MNIKKFDKFNENVDNEDKVEDIYDRIIHKNTNGVIPFFKINKYIEQGLKGFYLDENDNLYPIDTDLHKNRKWQQQWGNKLVFLSNKEWDIISKVHKNLNAIIEQETKKLNLYKQMKLSYVNEIIKKMNK